MQKPAILETQPVAVGAAFVMFANAVLQLLVLLSVVSLSADQLAGFNLVFVTFVAFIGAVFAWYRVWTKPSLAKAGVDLDYVTLDQDRLAEMGSRRYSLVDEGPLADADPDYVHPPEAHPPADG